MEKLICTSCKTTVDPHEDGGVACDCQRRYISDPFNEPYADSWMYVTDACDPRGPYPGPKLHTITPPCESCAAKDAEIARLKEEHKKDHNGGRCQPR